MDLQEELENVGVVGGALCDFKAVQNRTLDFLFVIAVFMKLDFSALPQIPNTC